MTIDSAYRITKYLLVMGTISVMAATASALFDLQGQALSAPPGTASIDISALSSSVEIAGLPVLSVEQAF
jgi:hypothetical protein